MTAVARGKSVFELAGFSPEVVAELSQSFFQGEGSTFQNSRAGIEAQTSFLIEILEEVRPRRILETGTHKAHFCYLARLAVPGVEIETFGLDSDSQLAVDVLNRRFGPFVRFRPGDSKQTLSAFDPPYRLDFAWIDGGHDVATCLRDLQNCARLGIPRVCVDDFRSEPEVRAAVAAFLELAPDYKVERTSSDPRGIAYLRRQVPAGQGGAL